MHDAAAGTGVVVATGAATDVGRVRAVNEDSLLTGPLIFVVADGMGGHEQGDVASALVVRTFAELTTQQSVGRDEVLQAVDRAHTVVTEAVDGGSTVAGAALVHESGQCYWLLFNVGDSRIYLGDAAGLQQISVDHSVVQEMVDAGSLTPAEAGVHPMRHVITRAIGSADDWRPDVWLLPVEVGQRILLCSDGLTGELDPSAVPLDADPQQAADALVRAAVDHGGRDNVTVVVVDVLTVPVDERDAVESTRPRPDEQAEVTR